MSAINLLHSLAILFILIPNTIFATSRVEHKFNDNEEYIVDAPFAHTRLRSRFLSTITAGTTCSQTINSSNKSNSMNMMNNNNKNVCDGISANNGASLLYCCKSRCVDVLNDVNNCGQCGMSCRGGDHCCNGTCTNVKDSRKNCGKCGMTCSWGHACQYGFCGYA